MADPYIAQAQNVFAATFGAAVTAGDMVYFDGTNWLLADADDATKFAEAMAAQGYKSGEKGVACTGGVIVDTDAPFTQGDEMYLSATAGAITATRPTGASNLVQVVGFCLSTSEVNVQIRIPHEVTLNVPFSYSNEAATLEGATESGDFGGASLIATSTELYGAFMVPQNCVKLEIGYLWWVADTTALDASDTYTIDCSGGVDDETSSAASDGITAAALTVAADDLNRADVTASMDASGIVDPGNVVSINVSKAAEGSSGDDPGMLVTAVVLQVV